MTVQHLTPYELAVLLASAPPPQLLVHRPADGRPVPHIPGSLVLDLRDLEVVVRSLRREAPVVICHVDRDQHVSRRLACELEAAGFRDVAVLRGGVAAWQRSGRPVEGGGSR